MSDDRPETLDVQELELEGVLLLVPPVYRDDRGTFREVFKQSAFEAATGIVRQWPQTNHSRSARGVLRGIHYQVDPPQGKIVSCLLGSVYDVAVDLRRSSPNFGRWIGTILSEDNGYQLWIPEGFGHGFYTLSDTADVHYTLTVEFAASGYRSVAWDDPEIGIDWPLEGEPLLSAADRAASALSQSGVP